MSEKILSDIKVLASDGENRFCFDCNERGPTYVNISIGSFVCTSCGGKLRMFSHRIKSIQMSVFSETELTFLKRRTNEACRRIYFGLCPGNQPPKLDIPFVDFLKMKYEEKAWYRDPPAQLEQEAFERNEVLILSAAEVKKNDTQKKKYSSNSTAGLIIAPKIVHRPTSVRARKNSIGSTLSSAPSTNSPAVAFQEVQAAPADPFGAPFQPLSDPVRVRSELPPTSNSSISRTAFVNSSPFGSSSFAPPTSNPEHTNWLSFPPTNVSSPPTSSQFTATDKYAALAALDNQFKDRSSPAVSLGGQDSFSSPSVGSPAMFDTFGMLTAKQTAVTQPPAPDAFQFDPFLLAKQRRASHNSFEESANPFAKPRPPKANNTLPADLDAQLSSLFKRPQTSQGAFMPANEPTASFEWPKSDLF